MVDVADEEVVEVVEVVLDLEDVVDIVLDLDEVVDVVDVDVVEVVVEVRDVVKVVDVVNVVEVDDLEDVVDVVGVVVVVELEMDGGLVPPPSVPQLEGSVGWGPGGASAIMVCDLEVKTLPFPNTGRWNLVNRPVAKNG